MLSVFMFENSWAIVANVENPVVRFGFSWFVDGAVFF